MVDADSIETKFSEKKEKVEEKIEDKKEERKEKYEDRKEKTKNFYDNASADISKSIDEFKESIKAMQKIADSKFNEYKQSTVQSLDVDLIETSNTYYLRVAVPGIEKEDISIEAGDNDITVEATFNPYIDEFTEEDEAEVIVSNLKKGKCVKTVRFENSIDIEQVSAKFSNGTVTITLPKLVIPKHKINVE